MINAISEFPFFSEILTTEWSFSKLLYYSSASVCSRNTIDLYAFDESHITLLNVTFSKNFFNLIFMYKKQDETFVIIGYTKHIK